MNGFLQGPEGVGERVDRPSLRNIPPQLPPQQRSPLYRRALGPVSRPVPNGPPPLRVDAVCVPTSRSSRQRRPGLAWALQLANHLQVPLLILRSGAAAGEKVPPWFKSGSGYPVITVDVPAEPPEQFTALLPPLASDGLEVASRSRSLCDTGFKRNVVLALGRLCGWQTVVIMDDDMEPLPAGRPADVDDLVQALSLKNVLHQMAAEKSFAVAVYETVWFHDHSVVGHTRRHLGQDPETFPGAGALVIQCGSPLSFFGRIYNEDWLFTLGTILMGHSAMPSMSVRYAGALAQAPYDPFVPGRSEAEELGDLLVEALFQELEASPVDVFSRVTEWHFWYEVMRAREIELRALAAEAVREADSRLIIDSLDAAIAVHKDWTLPEALAEYMREWDADRERWAEALDDLSPSCAGGERGIEDGLADLGLHGHDWNHRTSHGRPLASLERPSA